MRRYLSLASITIFVLTLLILMLLRDKVTGQVGTNILMVGVGTSVLTAIDRFHCKHSRRSDG